MGNAEAGITAEQTTRSNADSALASSITGLRASFDIVEDNFSLNFGEESYQTPGASISVEAQLTREQGARAAADGALAYDISTLTARMGSAEANITAEQQARANGDSALASSINTVSTRVGDNEATISQHATSINGLEAKAGLRLDVNGRITGWEANNDGSEGNFTVTTDKFELIDPDGGPRTEFQNGTWTVHDGTRTRIKLGKLT